MTVGERIGAARNARGMTQRELGKRLGITYQSISQWENNLRNPKYTTLLKLAMTLDVSVLYLLLGEEAPHAD